MLRGSEILLVRERTDDLWCSPGGWAAAKCEVWEETELEVRATRLLGLWNRNRHGHPPQPFYACKRFFLGAEYGGSRRASEETL